MVVFWPQKGMGLTKGVFLWVIKMAAVACKVTKPQAACTGSKPFVIKIFCLSIFIQDGQNKMTCVRLAFTRDKQILRRIVCPEDLPSSGVKTAKYESFFVDGLIESRDFPWTRTLWISLFLLWQHVLDSHVESDLRRGSWMIWQPCDVRMIVV